MTTGTVNMYVCRKYMPLEIWNAEKVGKKTDKIANINAFLRFKIFKNYKHLGICKKGIVQLIVSQYGGHNTNSVAILNQ